MATNVTQRNEVLRELLRWHSEKERLAVNRLFDGVTPPRQADVVYGELRAHTESTDHILSMLGYPDALPPAGGGAPMIYLIVDGELVDILTEMDEALAKAKKLAEHAGKVEIADLVTGRRTIIKQARKGNRR